jgi:FAD:protein FMN transferase
MTLLPRTSSPRRHPRHAVRWLAAAAQVLALVLLPGARSSRKVRTPDLESAEGARAALGDTCRVRADGRTAENAALMVAAVLDSVAGLDRVFARDVPRSEIAALDSVAPETRIGCSPLLWSALDVALATARETGGAYDPTMLPLERAWKEAAPLRPDPGTLRDARDRAGWDQVQLEPGTRSLRFPRDGMAIDLDGVAHGVALDLAVDVLRAGGIRRGRIALGEVTTVFADDGEAWGVPVEDPGSPGRTSMTVTARQGAVATAAPVQAMLDPRSGRLVLRTSGVTVVAHSAARAQALALALRVMGRDEAERYALAHRDVGVLWLEPDGSTLQAWRWNLTLVVPDPAVVVRWMP